MKVVVLFYGVLREVVKTDSLTIDEAGTSDVLMQKIIKKYPDIQGYKYNISLNNRFIRNNMILNGGDEIALIPPYEGG
jgi:molybdopterin converting factor small subunit